MSSKFSIFSHKPDGYSRQSGENFRLDVTGDSNLVQEVTDYLRESGHQIVETLEYEEETNGQRHYKRQRSE